MTRPLRVLIVSHLALPHVGGVENLVDLEVRALAEAGHEVRLLTSDGHGAGREPIYPANVRIDRVSAWHLLEHRLGIPYPLFGPTLIQRLNAAIDWADVVHAHGFLFANTAAAVWMSRLKHKPCILTDHGGIQRFSSRAATFAARIGAETVGRLSARLATRVVTYNQRVQTQLARLGSRSDVEFLLNPVNRDLFYPPSAEERRSARQSLGWDDSRVKVLFAGRLLATKGLGLLLETLDGSFDLVVCGPGDPAILGRLPRPGVEYLTPRPQAELVRLYHAADVFAMPAEVREGFPLVVQEAICCGLPVVLGYDPGFEPYRRIPNLFFCERTPEQVRDAIQRATTASRTEEASTGFFPSLSDWVSQLALRSKASPAARTPSASHLPATEAVS